MRPDSNTSTLLLIGIGVWAYFAVNFGQRVDDNSTTALQQSNEALQKIEVLSRQLDELPQRINDAISSSLNPMKQRVDDLRGQYSNTYTITAAQRDRAETSQTIAQMRDEINSNQNAIQATSGRVDTVEKDIQGINQKLEQIYQAVLTNRNTAQPGTAYSWRNAYEGRYQY